MTSEKSDFNLFLSCIGSHYSQKNVEKFNALPLEKICDVQRTWFFKGRAIIATENVDLHLTTDEYQEALLWIDSLILAKTTALKE